jgi:hypothetical protein
MDGGEWIEHLLTGLPGGVVGFLIFVNIFIFVLAFFLDFFEIAFIVIRCWPRWRRKLGIDLVWFGVLLCVNMQTSFMHPPFGFALFYLRGIAPPEVKSSDIADAGDTGDHRNLLAGRGDLLDRQHQGRHNQRQDRNSSNRDTTTRSRPIEIARSNRA